MIDIMHVEALYPAACLASGPSLAFGSMLMEDDVIVRAVSVVVNVILHFFIVALLITRVVHDFRRGRRQELLVVQRKVVTAVLNSLIRGEQSRTAKQQGEIYSHIWPQELGSRYTY